MILLRLKDTTHYMLTKVHLRMHLVTNGLPECPTVGDRGGRQRFHMFNIDNQTFQQNIMMTLKSKSGKDSVLYMPHILKPGGV